MSFAVFRLIFQVKAFLLKVCLGNFAVEGVNFQVEIIRQRKESAIRSVHFARWGNSRPSHEPETSQHGYPVGLLGVVEIIATMGGLTRQGVGFHVALRTSSVKRNNRNLNMTIEFVPTRSYVYKAARYELLPRVAEIAKAFGDEPFLLRDI